MRYIRTKDGIEQALYGEEFREGKSYFYKTEYQWVHGDVYYKVKVKTYAKNGITRIADTIEELCDEFVIEDRDEFAIFHNLKLAKKTKGIIYGAIWTDKGLIYVAKMNDKGELELL